MADRPHVMIAAEPRTIPPRWFAVVAALQLAGLAWFLMVSLPGAALGQYPRSYLLLQPDSYIITAFKNLSEPAHLGQRLPVLGASLLVAAACWAVGSWVVRGLRLGPETTRLERIALGFAVGVPLVGGATLILGRWLGLSSPVIRATLGLVTAVGLIGALWDRRKKERTPIPRWSVGQVLWFAALVGPFLLLMILGAMLPTVEFDALEYHLQAPKEYVLDGRISLLEHNVYASMPSGVEMLTTLAMAVVGDWWLGALAGQAVIALCAPAAAVLIAGAAARVAGPGRAGWWAALIYLTTPWVFRLGNTPFVEGPLALMHAALVWAVIRWGWFQSVDPQTEDRSSRRVLGEGLLVGLLAGGALAIKYPGLVSAVVPAGVAVAIEARRLRLRRLAIGFAIGLTLTAGPWLVKNVIDHGNPVYPLAYSIFDGADWDSAREGRWQVAHGPRPIRLDLLLGSLLDVAGRSGWQSPLYLVLAPLAAFGVARSRRVAGGLALYAAYLFATWWLLTHRLDRFWLPMLPGLAVLAGLGANALASRSRAWLAVIAGVAWAMNLTLCSTELAGPTAWTESYATLRDRTYRDGTPSLFGLDALLPPDARPLVIGQAGTFGLRHRPIYSTVFDVDRFEMLTSGFNDSDIAAAFRNGRITHIYVDWAEIERYRQPGNYGFTPFVVPARFDRLVAAGILAHAIPVGERQVLYPVISQAAAVPRP